MSKLRIHKLKSGEVAISTGDTIVTTFADDKPDFQDIEVPDNIEREFRENPEVIDPVKENGNIKLFRVTPERKRQLTKERRDAKEGKKEK